ncbi:MAG: site-specific integrase [Anaerolineales bacterium]|nr:site-specific integrase [Anaerolineales bacterium]
MINRENWLDSKKYLLYLENVKQNDDKTLARRRSQMRHLLEWADEQPFPKARTIDPTYQQNLASIRREWRGEHVPLSPESIEAALDVARSFFSWARLEYPRRYYHLSESWIDALRPSRSQGKQSEYREREYYSLESVLKITSLKPETTIERRNIAAVAFLFASGMRAGAFLTLPLECVDLENLRIRQFPSKGVKTKNSKAAITTLLSIPELLDVIREWDEYLRGNLPESSLWYAQLKSDAMTLAPAGTYTGSKRHKALLLGVQRLCERAGIEYLSPHKLRHGHAVYGTKHAQTYQDFKAVSQNLMHGSVTITDSIYGVLAESDVHDTILKLSHAGNLPTKPGVDTITQLSDLLKILQENPTLRALLSKG